MIESVPIVIVGGGPVGLTLSLELSRFGVAHVLVSQNTETSTHPKCNLANARTMEHFRRLGIAEDLRAEGLPNDRPQDSIYFTRLNQPEISRFKIASSGSWINAGPRDSDVWPTPEPPYRISQIYIERFLKAKAEKSAVADIRFGNKLVGLSQDSDGVSLEIEDVIEGGRSKLNSQYVIGCDGPRSFVRQESNIRYAGMSSAVREMFGGTMKATHFRSAELAQILGQHEPGHMYWAMNGDGRSVTIAIDGASEFLNHVQISQDGSPDDWDPRKYIPQYVGEPVSIDVISSEIWKAGYSLVAEKFQHDRAFLAGDAAHLFTPTGGLGMNTGIDDAVNLGWKLAAKIQGWGSDRLLSSYTIERQPVGERNTSAAKMIADVMASVFVPSDIEAQNEIGSKARAKLGRDLSAMAEREFNTVGIQLGVDYKSKEISAVSDETFSYAPCAMPGRRAPHTWLGEGHSVIDLFGCGFTLLVFDGDAPGSSALVVAADRRRVPLAVEVISDVATAALYGKKLVLVRPDGHIAWIGDSLVDADAIWQSIVNPDSPTHMNEPQGPSVT